jgi:hypothetical protein
VRERERDRQLKREKEIDGKIEKRENNTMS